MVSLLKIIMAFYSLGPFCAAEKLEIVDIKKSNIQLLSPILIENISISHLGDVMHHIPRLNDSRCGLLAFPLPIFDYNRGWVTAMNGSPKAAVGEQRFRINRKSRYFSNVCLAGRNLNASRNHQLVNWRLSRIINNQFNFRLFVLIGSQKLNGLNSYIAASLRFADPGGFFCGFNSGSGGALGFDKRFTSEFCGKSGRAECLTEQPYSYAGKYRGGYRTQSGPVGRRPDITPNTRQERRTLIIVACGIFLGSSLLGAGLFRLAFWRLNHDRNGIVGALAFIVAGFACAIAIVLPIEILSWL